MNSITNPFKVTNCSELLDTLGIVLVADETVFININNDDCVLQCYKEFDDTYCIETIETNTYLTDNEFTFGSWSSMVEEIVNAYDLK